jgi:hypothetical protein
MHRETEIALRKDRPLPLPNQGEVSHIQPRWPGKRDCVGGGAGSLTQAVLHRVDFPFWVCHYVIIMSRNKRAPQVGSMPCLARLVERRSPARSGLGFLYSLRSCEKQTRRTSTVTVGSRAASRFLRATVQTSSERARWTELKTEPAVSQRLASLYKYCNEISFI